MRMLLGCCTTRPRLLRRLGCAQRLAVDPGAVEATGTALARREHVAGSDDAPLAGLGLLPGSDPVDPVPPRDGREAGPLRLRRGRGRERLAQVDRNTRLGFHRHRRDLERDGLARDGAGGVPQRPAHLQPMAALAVGFQRGLEAMAIERAAHGRHAPRRQLRAGLRRQHEERPGGALGTLGPQQCRLEADIGSGLGHGGNVSAARLRIIPCRPAASGRSLRWSGAVPHTATQQPKGDGGNYMSLIASVPLQADYPRRPISESDQTIAKPMG